MMAGRQRCRGAKDVGKRSKMDDRKTKQRTQERFQ